MGAQLALDQPFALEVDSNLPPPVVETILENRAQHGNGGVVDEDVDSHCSAISPIAAP